MSGGPHTVDVVQIGARRHYAVPLMLESAGLLRHFHTDVYCGPGSSLHLLQNLPASLRSRAGLRKMLERTSTLPAARVRAHNRIGLAAKWRMRSTHETMDRMRVHHRLQDELNAAVLRETRTPADLTYGFRGAETLFTGLKGRSVCVLDQIDGGIHAVTLVRREQEAHLDWMSSEPDWLACRRTGATWWMDIEGERLRREWAAADHIICNSVWTRTCLEIEGVPAAKCSVVPLAYETRTRPPESPGPARAGNGLRVAFLGTLSLMKGIHHLVEAARRAAREAPVRVLIAGAAHDVLPARIEAYRDVAEYLGVLPRSRVPEFLRSCDVLALPSLSEGFGMVQLEAMSEGLPVIASDHTGDVVRDGIDGYRVPAGDVDTLAARLVTLARQPELCRAFGAAARERVRDFAPERVAGLLRNTLEKLWNQHPLGGKAGSR